MEKDRKDKNDLKSPEFDDTIPFDPSRPDTMDMGFLSSPTAFTPEVKGRYRLLDAKQGKFTLIKENAELARGGMGRILCCFDTHTNREIVIKERLIDQSQGEFVKSEEAKMLSPVDVRFIREARITAQLEHPHIVPVYEIGRREDGRLYYTMRRIKGITLSEALAGCNSLAERMEYLPHFLNLCNAVAYAHSKGIIHRDIKPQNVMVSDFGETVLLDWGLAKIIRGEEQQKGAGHHEQITVSKSDVVETLAGYALGTPSYMPPEQAEGDIEKMDTRCDVYSLGAVLYEILTGKPPYKSGSFLSTVADVLTKDPIPIRKLQKGVPDELVHIAMTAMSRDRDLRFLNAGEMARAVQAYLSGKFVPPPEGGLRPWLSYLWRTKRKIIALLVVLMVVVTGFVFFHVSRMTAMAEKVEIAAQETRNVMNELKKEKERFNKMKAIVMSESEYARTYTGSARGLTLIAHALLLDDTSETRAKFYKEAIARPYGLAETGFAFSSPCKLIQVPSSYKGNRVVCLMSGSVDGKPPGKENRELGGSGETFSLMWLDRVSLDYPVPVNLQLEERIVAVDQEGNAVLMTPSGKVRILDDTGKEKANFKPVEKMNDIEIIAAGSGFLVSAGNLNGEVFLLDIDGGKVWKVANVNSPIMSMSFSNNNELVIVDSSGGVWQNAGYKSETFLAGRICAPAAKVTIASSRGTDDGGFAVVAVCNNGVIESGRVKSGAYIKKASMPVPTSASGLVALDISNDGRDIFFGTISGEIGKIRQISEKGDMKVDISAVGHTGKVVSVVNSPRGMVSSGIDGYVKFWPSSGIPRLLPFHTSNVSLHGKLLDADVRGQVLVRQEKGIVLQSLERNTVNFILEEPEIRDAHLSADGRSIIILTSQGEIKQVFVDREKNAQPTPFKLEFLQDADSIKMLDETGRAISAATSSDGKFVLFDYQTQKEIGIARKWGEGGVAQIVIDPFYVNLGVLYKNGSFYMGSINGDLPVWKIESMNIRSIALTDYGKWLIMVDGNGNLWVYNFISKELIAGPCKNPITQEKSPAYNRNQPADCLIPTGVQGILGMSMIDNGHFLVDGPGGFVIYDIFAGKPVIGVPTKWHDSSMVTNPNLAGERILVEWEHGEIGGITLSLWPIAGWIVDSPDRWINRVRRATGYKVDEWVPIPLSPIEWKNAFSN